MREIVINGGNPEIIEKLLEYKNNPESKAITKEGEFLYGMDEETGVYTEVLFRGEPPIKIKKANRMITLGVSVSSTDDDNEELMHFLYRKIPIK